MGNAVSVNYENVALSITKRLLQQEGKDSNVVFSPLSVHLVLCLIGVGTKEGPSLRQLLSFLKGASTKDLTDFISIIANKVFEDIPSNNGPSLAFGTDAWYEQLLSLKRSFVEAVHPCDFRKADFINKPWEVISEVNSWADKLTHGLIKEVLLPGSIHSSCRLIFANALYIKGTWTYKFDASKTKEDGFDLLDGTYVRVPFMNNYYTRQYIGEYNGFRVVSLPYEHGLDKRRFSMNFFLPNAMNGLPSLIDKLDSQPNFIRSHIPKVQKVLGEFKIPKFKISYGVEVSNVLKALGLVLPFTRGSADLFEMVENSPLAKTLYVGLLSQKSYIEIDEEGTEVAGGTSGVIQERSNMKAPKLIDFIADHPFLYAIYEHTNDTLIFIGQVLNPCACSEY